MAKKLKLKDLFSDNIKKLKAVEKPNKDLSLFSVLFELAGCHTLTLEEIHKCVSKVTEFYTDFNEFRATELEDIAEDFGMPDRVDDLIPLIDHLDIVFEKNGIVDLADLGNLDDTKVEDLFGRLKGNINATSFSYYLNRLGKAGPYVFSDNQVRILKRLKLVEEEDDFETVRKKVEKVFPGEKGTSFSLACQIHANEFCREENPSCARCPLLKDCEYGQNLIREKEDKEREREEAKRKLIEEEQRKEENEKKKVKPPKKRKDKSDAEEFGDEVEPISASAASDAAPVKGKRGRKRKEDVLPIVEVVVKPGRGRKKKQLVDAPTAQQVAVTSKESELPLKNKKAEQKAIKDQTKSEVKVSTKVVKVKKDKKSLAKASTVKKKTESKAQKNVLRKTEKNVKSKEKKTAKKESASKVAVKSKKVPDKKAGKNKKTNVKVKAKVRKTEPAKAAKKVKVKVEKVSTTKNKVSKKVAPKKASVNTAKKSIKIDKKNLKKVVAKKTVQKPAKKAAKKQSKAPVKAKKTTAKAAVKKVAKKKK